MKLSSNDLLQVLRQYKIATVDNFPRQISSIKYYPSSLDSTVLSFCFLNNKYYTLVDSAGSDESASAMEKIKVIDPNHKINLLQNPYLDNEASYSIPFKGKACHLFSVVSEKIRLDNELHRRYPEISRSLCQKHIKAGLVTIDGVVHASVNQLVTPINQIAINLPKENDYSKNQLPIIYIDDNIIVVDKPIGVLSHAKGATSDEFTVADFFKKYTTFNADTNRPGIIHRLDRDTSGVIVGARNDETAVLLQKQFSNRKTKKIYLAITDGQPKLDQAHIDLPIGRNKSKPSTFRVDPSGKSANTSYTVLSKNEKYSLILLQPQTGRTHQLRVHLSYLNVPILGDKIYGRSAERLFLHAYSLEITMPNGERKIFTSPIPDAFKKYFKDISL